MNEFIIMEGEVDPDKVFRTVDSGNRQEIEALVLNPSVSLGLVDPVDGITLVYDLLTKVINGEKIVMKKLDACVSSTVEDVDLETFAIKIDHKNLVDDDPRSLKVLRDLLTFNRNFTLPIFQHPVIITFIERRWPKRWFYMTSFIYLMFVISFTLFSVAMFAPYDDHPYSSGQYLGLVCEDYQDDPDFLQDCVTGISTRAQMKIGLNKIFRSDLELCVLSLTYFLCLIVLMLIEFLQSYSLGIEYFREAENWFELIIYILAIACFFSTSAGPVLSMMASITTCLMWIQLIFLYGRFPSNGGMFSLLYYASAQRVLMIAVGLGILSISFGLAFYVLEYNFVSDEQAQEKSLLKSLVHSFVMIMGGYDFDFLWQASSEAQNFSEETKYIPVRLITMVLLITLIMFGTLILMNLIVAFIITDMGYLMEVTKLIALRNQVLFSLTINFSLVFTCIDCRLIMQCRPRLSRTSSVVLL